MKAYLDFSADPAAAAAALDAESGNVLFLCGLDRAEAASVMAIYAANSTLGGALDETGTRYTAGSLIVQGAWETYISVTQAHVWTTAWDQWFCEESLSPSRHLVQVFDAIVAYYATD